MALHWNLAVKALELVYTVASLLWRCTLAVANLGRGKAVPEVTDPVLLKSATRLAKEIRERKLKSEDVISAYIRRIEIVEPYINAMAHPTFEKALEEARAVDALLASGKWTEEQLEAEKPLLGVPFTVKCLITVKNLPSTAGSVQFKNVIAAEDGDTVARMKRAGAIVLATTNTAEVGCSIETNNNVYGKTCNPYDTRRTSGGSSGGESAIVAAAGSVIGIGNDLAGSIRIPGLYTGIFGHKPSQGMVSNRGQFPNIQPKTDEQLTTGPMCRYAEDLIVTMRVFAQKDKPPKFYRQVNLDKLKICYMTSIEGTRFTVDMDSEVTQALEKVISYFESNHGIKAQKVDIPLLKYSQVVCVSSLLMSDPNILRTVTAGKENINLYKETLKFLLRTSNYTIGVLMALWAQEIGLFCDEKSVAFSTRTVQQLESQFETLLDEDTVFLFPTLPVTAPYHYELPLIIISAVYTWIFNVLGLPSTQCPLGLDSRGLPLGIQVVGRKDNDPLTVAVAQELEKAFGGWVQPPKRHSKVKSMFASFWKMITID